MQSSKFFTLLLIFFGLINAAFAELDFTITAEATTEAEKQSQKITEISSEQIQSFHASNCAEVLRKAANANVKQYGSYGSAFSVYLRSFNGGTVAVLVDGVQVNSAQTGEFDLTRINVNDIEKIEIIEGASDSKYCVSGSVGGIINIITKQNKNTETSKKIIFTGDISNLFYSGLLSGGTFFDTQNYFISLSQNTAIANWKISGSFINAKNNYSYTNFLNKKKLRDNADAKTCSAYASSLFKIKNSSLQITDNFFNGFVHTPGTETSIITGNQKDLYNCLNLIYKNPEVLNSLADLSFQLSYKFDRTFFDENCKDYNEEDISLHKLHTICSNFHSSFYLNDFLSFTAASDFTINLLNSTNCDNGDNLINKNVFGLSVSGDYSIKYISFYPSFKLVYTDLQFSPVPKFGIRLNKLNLCFNVYRMFTTPTLNQLYWKNTSYAEGNPNLKNESGWGTDLNYTFTKKNLFKLQTGVFAMYYKDKIQWIQFQQGKYKCQNVAKAAYFGGNLFLDFAPCDYLTFKAKYDLNLSYLLSSGYKIKDNKRIMYTPANIFSFDADLHFKTVKLNLSYTFTGKRFKSNDNSTFLPFYNLFDISTELDLNSKVQLYIILNNILNERYYEIDGYPMPGFSCKSGVKIKL